MFDFVGKFFRGRPDKKKAIEAEARRRAALKRRSATPKPKGVAYDEGLIENLERDHELLVEVYGRIWNSGFETGNFEEMGDHVRVFKSLFESHLLKENVKFYAYLEQSMRHDTHSLDVVREFRRDMNDIANAVIGFCKKYEHVERDKVVDEDFKREYQGIGQALVRRVQLEERDLYSLYAPI